MRFTRHFLFFEHLDGEGKKSKEWFLSSRPAGGDTNTQKLAGKLAGQARCNGGITENVSFGGPANGQALSLEWGVQNGGALGPTH